MAAPPLDLTATAYHPEQFPPAKGAEIVMAGRSNVGKSSLINQIAGKSSRLKNKQGARVSQKPGCTRSINFYRFTPHTTLVDLPGYGYAKLPLAQRDKLKRLIESYFKSRPNIALLVHIVDARLPLQPLDWQMLEWGYHFGYPYLLTLNKCDKLSRSLLARREQEVRAVASSKLNNLQWITLSALTGQGVAACKRIFEESVQTFLAKSLSCE